VTELNRKVALITTTFNKTASDLRFKLVLRTCDEAKQAGYPIYVVDDSPDPTLGQIMVEHGANVEKQIKKGMGASRRQVIKMGLDSGAEAILWLEPEKYPLVPLLRPCINMILGPKGYEIVVPRRFSLDSYPDYQHWSELRANWELGNITGRPDLDLMFGPRFLSRAGAGLLLGYTGESGDNWEILMIPIFQAIHNGWKVGSKIVAYKHPPEQTAAEQWDVAMNKKRDEQRTSLIAAMRGEAERHSFIGLD
jgi:hypothetical protein